MPRVTKYPPSTPSSRTLRSRSCSLSIRSFSRFRASRSALVSRLVNSGGSLSALVLRPRKERSGRLLRPLRDEYIRSLDWCWELWCELCEWPSCDLEWPSDVPGRPSLLELLPISGGTSGRGGGLRREGRNFDAGLVVKASKRRSGWRACHLDRQSKTVPYPRRILERKLIAGPGCRVARGSRGQALSGCDRTAADGEVEGWRTKEGPGWVVVSQREGLGLAAWAQVGGALSAVELRRKDDALANVSRPFGLVRLGLLFDGDNAADGGLGGAGVPAACAPHRCRPCLRTRGHTAAALLRPRHDARVRTNTCNLTATGLLRSRTLHLLPAVGCALRSLLLDRCAGTLASRPARADLRAADGTLLPASASIASPQHSPNVLFPPLIQPASHSMIYSTGLRSRISMGFP